MERHLLPPPQHLMPSSGFFNLSGGGVEHFPSCGGCGFAATPVGLLHDCGWAGEHPMQLGAEMFGGGVSTVGGALVGNQAVWQCVDGSSSRDPPQAPAGIISLDGDGDDGRPPLAVTERESVPELAAEPRRNEGNVVMRAKKRKDRAKTVVLERKRRVRMTEKLYQLRLLVPNITKMDKASIIGDAVEYVKSLQSHARKLKEEVAALEARQWSSSPGPQDPRHDRGVAVANDKRQDEDATGGARVASVGATQVGEGRFLVTVECERRDGAAARLFAAVESLACFRVESSSVGLSAPDRLVSTATLKATCQAEAPTIGEGTVKLLKMAALGEKGFRIEATAGIS